VQRAPTRPEHRAAHTLTDIHTGWNELAGLWEYRGRKVCVGLRRIEAWTAFGMLGFDWDNGSEFLNAVGEQHLLGKGGHRAGSAAARGAR